MEEAAFRTTMSAIDNARSAGIASARNGRSYRLRIAGASVLAISAYQLSDDAEAAFIMGDNSAIGWTQATWNPISGCTRVSAGCDNCYASTLHNQRYKANVKAA